MKLLNVFFFILLIGCNNNSIKDVFDIARNGTIIEMNTLIKENPQVVNKKNKSGYTPLILASYHSNQKIVKFLIKNHAKINEVSELGTALMAASYKADNEIAKILIEHGANVNLTDKNGKTALHYACFQQNVPLVKLLIKNKAKSNIKDTDGKTALDFAIDNNNIEIIKILKP